MMLTIFVDELNTTQCELNNLLAKVDALRGQMKSLKANQVKVSKFIDNCKNLLTELPELAIAELKKEILSLFPSDPEPSKETTEIFTNFVTEVPKTEVTTPEITKTEEVNDRWNPAHFGDLEFNADDNGQLNLLKVATIEPPEPDDFLVGNVIDLQQYKEAWAEWEKQNKPVKAATAPVEEAIDDDNWPEVEEKAEEDNSLKATLVSVSYKSSDGYAAQVFLSESNDTVSYLKRVSDGQILSAYIGCSTKKLATEWEDLLKLWGCKAEARKSQRMSGAKWETKITNISLEQLETIARNHQHLYDGVPAGNVEYTKKLTSGQEKINENSSDLNQQLPQSDLPTEKSEISIEVKAAEDAEVILKGEQAKADILPNYSQPNQQKVFAGDLIRVKSNCHHKSVIGLTGVVTVASQAGCIAKFEDVGNRWLTNDQVEIVKESQLVS